jgi:hypothetical protein
VVRVQQPTQRHTPVLVGLAHVAKQPCWALILIAVRRDHST